MIYRPNPRPACRTKDEAGRARQRPGGPERAEDPGSDARANRSSGCGVTSVFIVSKPRVKRHRYLVLVVVPARFPGG